MQKNSQDNDKLAQELNAAQGIMHFAEHEVKSFTALRTHFSGFYEYLDKSLSQYAGKRLYTIDTLGRKITNCSRHRIVALPTRCNARGRVDEKFAPFALSSNSSSATYSSCGACGAIPATIHLIASHS